MARYVAGRRPTRTAQTGVAPAPTPQTTYSGLFSEAAIVDENLVLHHHQIETDGTPGILRERRVVPLGAIAAVEVVSAGHLGHLLVHLRGHPPTRPMLDGSDSFLLHPQHDVSSFVTALEDSAAGATPVDTFEPAQAARAARILQRRDRPIRDSPILDWLQGG